MNLKPIAVVLAMMAIACTKVNVENVAEPESKKVKKLKCDLESITESYPNGPSRQIFNKSYDPSGKHVVHLEAGLYSGGGIAQTVPLDLIYAGNMVYFLSASNAADTGLIVELNKDGRPQKVTSGHIIDYGFGPQEFFYDQGRLQLVNIDNNWLRIWMKYDAWGNVTNMVTDSSGGYARINVSFEYDHSKPIPYQVYRNEAHGFSYNVLLILHQAGFFPELNPVHARTRSTVLWGQYLAYDFDLVDHVVSDGKLMSFKTRSHNYGFTSGTFTSNWDCRGHDEEVQ